MKLTLEQEIAYEQCTTLSNPVFAVTGGAGTGKTTLLKSIYTELAKNLGGNSNVILCAPTGRAAKRIQEATGIAAVTIHRLLEFPKPSEDDVEIVGVGNTYAPRRNAYRPLMQRAVLVDEASMIGPVLDGQLRNALNRHAIIRYFGDANQLPPVEEGRAPFRELIQGDNAVWLTTNFRSDDEIIGNTQLILRGRMPQRNSRFEIIYTEEPIRALLEYCGSEFKTDSHQIIMTMRKGNYGTNRANPSLQIRFNPNGDFLQLDRLEEKAPPLTVKPTDKFLWTKNDYNFDMFNGEIGVIDGVDTEDGSLSLGLVDRPSLHIPPLSQGKGPYGPYTYDPRKQIDLGYAITTHKSQGSEFDTVVYAMCSKGQGGMFMCSRNNFYTGVTRAKKHVVVICDRKAMQVSLRKVV